MIESFRRIASTLVLISVFSFGVSVFVSIPNLCSNPSDCVANVSMIQSPNITIPQSTPTMGGGDGLRIDFALVNKFVQTTSIYLLLLSLAVIISLEFAEVKYLKSIIRNYKKKRT